VPIAAPGACTDFVVTGERVKKAASPQKVAVAATSPKNVDFDSVISQVI
jgi:hypothetical protein